MNKIKAMTLSLAFFALAACGGGIADEHNDGSITDKRDGKTYKTVKIDEQVWMAENINYNVAGGKCYGEGGQVADKENNKLITLSNTEIQANCDKYGRLYNWEIAKTVCPSGWHLPSYLEWNKLVDYIESSNGCRNCAGEYLKATSGWNSFNGVPGNGTDNYGFSALPGGYYYFRSIGNFIDIGEEARWWTATELVNDPAGAYDRNIYYNDSHVGRGGSEKHNILLSVRCVKN